MQEINLFQNGISANLFWLDKSFIFSYQSLQDTFPRFYVMVVNYFSRREFLATLKTRNFILRVVTQVTRSPQRKPKKLDKFYNIYRKIETIKGLRVLAK